MKNVFKFYALMLAICCASMMVGMHMEEVKVQPNDVARVRQLDQTKLDEQGLNAAQREWLERNAQGNEFKKASLKNQLWNKGIGKYDKVIHTNSDGSQVLLTQDEAKSLRLQGHFNHTDLDRFDAEKVADESNVIGASGTSWRGFHGYKNPDFLYKNKPKDPVQITLDTGIDSQFQTVVDPVDGLTKAQRSFIRRLRDRGSESDKQQADAWKKRFEEQNKKQPPNIIKIHIHDVGNFKDNPQVALNADVAADMAKKGLFSHEHKLDYKTTGLEVGTFTVTKRGSNGDITQIYHNRAAAHPIYHDTSEKDLDGYNEKIETDDEKKNINSNYQTKIRRNGLTDAQNDYANTLSWQEASAFRAHCKEQHNLKNIIKIHTNLDHQHKRDAGILSLTKGTLSNKKVPLDARVASELSKTELFSNAFLDQKEEHASILSDDGEKDLGQHLNQNPVKTVHQQIRDKQAVSQLVSEINGKIVQKILEKYKINIIGLDVMSQSLPILNKVTEGKTLAQLQQINIEHAADQIVTQLRQYHELQGKFPEAAAHQPQYFSGHFEEQLGDILVTEGVNYNTKEKRAQLLKYILTKVESKIRQENPTLKLNPEGQNALNSEQSRIWSGIMGKVHALDLSGKQMEALNKIDVDTEAKKIVDELRSEGVLPKSEQKPVEQKTEMPDIKTAKASLNTAKKTAKKGQEDKKLRAEYDKLKEAIKEHGGEKQKDDLEELEKEYKKLRSYTLAGKDGWNALINWFKKLFADDTKLVAAVKSEEKK